MELYSGQGRIFLDRKDGSKRFFLGNAPKFVVNFKTGDLEIVSDELSDGALEVLCGSRQRDDGGFEIGDGSPFEYELTFEGVNTACGNKELRVVLGQVKLTSTERWDLIGDDFATFKVTGNAGKDETGKRGVVYRTHQEAQTGNRVIDTREVVKQV